MDAKSLARIERLNYVFGAVLIVLCAVLTEIPSSWLISSTIHTEWPFSNNCRISIRRLDRLMVPHSVYVWTVFSHNSHISTFFSIIN